MKTKRSASSFMSAFAVLKNRKSLENDHKVKKKKKILKRSSSRISNDKTSQNSSTSKSKRRKSSVRVNNSAAASDLTEVVVLDASEHIPCGNLDAQKTFEWLIYPVSPEYFFSEMWEKSPLHIRRGGKSPYKGIFSCKEFDQILREHHIEYTKNIDIVRYHEGTKEVLEADGRAYAPVVWDYYQNDWSVRLLNPQTYSRSVWKLNSLLQEYFGSFVGANVYLTPPGSQGFAPHYDDIEAFIMQLEGKKLWKIYSPRSQFEELPRFSSVNFSQDKIGDPVLEIELGPGDLLYFPRGYIHQACTPEDSHSLHITLSTYQKNTWGDLLEKIVPQALALAMENDIEYRQSLPKDYLNYLGTVNVDKNSTKRRELIEKLIKLIEQLSHYILIDTGADKFAQDYIHSCLPPCLTLEEKACSIHRSEELCSEGNVRSIPELNPDTEIRLIRGRAVRLLREEGYLRLYHTLENSRIYKETEALYVAIDFELAPAVERLIHEYPNYIKIENLPVGGLQAQMEIANLLYDKGLVRTKIPLETEDSS